MVEGESQMWVSQFWYGCRDNSNSSCFSVGEIYSRIEPDDMRPSDGWSLGLSKMFE